MFMYFLEVKFVQWYQKTK